MRPFLLLFASLLLNACSQKHSVTLVPRADETRETKQVEQNTIHQHSIKLAKGLLSAIKQLDPDASIAVGSFLPADTLNLNNANQREQYIGLQLQESLITLYSQMGYKVVEYRARKKIAVQQQQDNMLSRQTKRLHTQHKIDYLLTGTLVPQQHGYVVNARLVNTHTHHVISAATDYVPNNVLFSADKVHIEHGKLDRTRY